MPNRFQRTMQRVARGLFGIQFGTSGADSWQFAYNFEHGLPLQQLGKLTDPYARSPIAAVAISVIADDAASVGWKLYPADDPEADALEDHPLFEALARPNLSMLGRQLWIGTYISRQLWGEAFWYYPDLRIVRPGLPSALRDMPSADESLVLLDPRSVISKVDDSTGVVSWFLRVRGQEEPLDPEYLTHFKRWNPYNPVRGLSKVLAVIAELEGDYASSQWNERFFSVQNGVPSGLLKPGLPSTGAVAMTTRDQRTEFLRTFTQRHGGTKRSVGMLPAGWDWIDLGITQRDMDFRSLREYSREQILGLFGVPPFLAGVLDKANYANAREQKEVYWLGTQTRFLTEIANTLNHDFLPKMGLGELELRPDWERVKALVENLAEKVEVASKLWGMGVPFMQINERLDLGFDTDEMEGAEVGYLPFSVTPVTSLLEPRTPVGPTARPDDVSDQERAVDRLNGTCGSSMVLPAPDEQRRLLVWRNLILRTKDLEERFYRLIRRHLHDLEQEVLGALSGVRGWKVERQRDVPVIFDLDGQKKKLQKLTGPAHRAALKRGGESVLADLGLSIVFDMREPGVLARLAEMTAMITRIDDTIEHALRDSLIEGLQASETLDQLRDRVQNVIRDATAGRARTIARTETGMAFNAGRHLSMRQAGIERHEWLSSRDPDVRDTHVAEDRNVVEIHQPFPVTGLMYPQDPSGPPGEIINCRCVALPVVE